MIFYITTYDKNVEYAKKVKQMFEKTNFEYYFVYGKDQTEKVEPYIEVDCEEKYETLSLKTYLILEHFLSTKHAHMLKMDDDTYIDFILFNPNSFTQDYVGMFVTYPTNLKTSIFHWYKINTPEYKVPMKTFDLDYAEGGCYILSKKAAKICYDKKQDFYIDTPETYLGEDTRIGMCLNRNDITKLDLMNNKGLMYEATKDLMFIHPVHTILFDKLFEAKTHEEKMTLLHKYNFLNLNLKREIFLTNTAKELQCKT